MITSEIWHSETYILQVTQFNLEISGLSLRIDENKFTPLCNHITKY